MGEVLKTGTTIIGLKYKDGIILGADRRMTAGGMIMSTTAEKIAKLRDHLAVAFAGTVSDVQLLVDSLKSNFSYFEKDRSRKITVQEASGFMGNQMKQHIRSASVGPVGFILAGYDTKPGLYEIYGDGTLTEYSTFVSQGSGSIFAIGTLENEFKENMNKDEALALVKKAIKTAVRKDNSSGDGILIYNIDQSGANLYSNESI